MVALSIGAALPAARANPSGHQITAPPPPPALAPLRVIAVNTFKPISSADDDGKPVGIVEDYFELVRQALDLPVGDVRVMKAADAEDALRHGGADIVIGIVRSEERSHYGLFTVPVYSTPAVIVTRHGALAAPSLAALRGKTLSLRENHFAIGLLRQHYPTIKIFQSGTESRAVLQAVVDRRADAALVSLDASRVWLSDPHFSSLVVSGFPPDLPYEFAFQVHPSLSALMPGLDQAIAQITVEQRADIMERWLNEAVRVKSSKGGIPLATAMFGAVGVAAILILAYFLAGMRRELWRHRHEAERARAEREAALRGAETNPPLPLRRRA